MIIYGDTHAHTGKLSSLAIFNTKFRFSTTDNQADQESYWYIMDEVGSSLQHSDVYNAEIHPFIYCRDLMEITKTKTGESDPSQRITYSILWPKKKIEKDEIITRDFLPRITEDDFRSARLCTWFITPEKYYKDALVAYREEVKQIKAKHAEFEEIFNENQQKDGSYLDELKNLNRPVKIYPYYVSNKLVMFIG